MNTQQNKIDWFTYPRSAQIMHKFICRATLSIYIYIYIILEICTYCIIRFGGQ